MRILIIILILTLGNILLSWLVSDTFILTALVFLSVICAIYYLNKIDLFWKIYAYILAMFTLFDCVGFLFYNYTVVDYLSIPVSIITTVGVFLYVLKKQFGNSFLWVLVLLLNFVFLYLQRENIMMTESDIAAWGILGITLYILLLELIIAPQYLALFKYILCFDHVLEDSNQEKPEEPST